MTPTFFTFMSEEAQQPEPITARIPSLESRQNLEYVNY
jgi:hypothetical protein